LSAGSERTSFMHHLVSSVWLLQDSQKSPSLLTISCWCHRLSAAPWVPWQGDWSWFGVWAWFSFCRRPAFLHQILLPTRFGALQEGSCSASPRMALNGMGS